MDTNVCVHTRAKYDTAVHTLVYSCICVYTLGFSKTAFSLRVAFTLTRAQQYSRRILNTAVCTR